MVDVWGGSGLKKGSFLKARGELMPFRLETLGRRAKRLTSDYIASFGICLGASLTAVMIPGQAIATTIGISNVFGLPSRSVATLNVALDGVLAAAPSISSTHGTTLHHSTDAAVNSDALLAQYPGSLNPLGDRPSFEDSMCQPSDVGSQRFRSSPQGLMHQVTQQTTHLANWIEQPDYSMQQLLGQWGPELMARLSASPWPEINDRARLSRVPILMYHDILPRKEVFFDVTPDEFEQHLQMIQENELTPISLDDLVLHLRTGVPLPPKPVLLTFDDGYLGHYEYVFPLLKQYGYPGVFSIYTYKVGRDHGRPGLNWAQVQEMAADPLVTIAAHSVTHPRDLREIDNQELQAEVRESKRILEETLGIPIRYFTYPEGNYDARVAGAVKDAGFVAALAMNNGEQRVAGESPHLLAIDRMGQSYIRQAIADTWGGFPLPSFGSSFNFSTAIHRADHDNDEMSLTLISGGKPVTIHADSRYSVSEIIEGTNVVAAVDGGFFSLKYLDSNVMVGPVMGRNTGEFIPGNPGENPLLAGRPLVLISDRSVKFVPFNPAQHNTLEGIQAEMADVTDAFVSAGWLVENGEGRSRDSFGSLFDFDANRHRAFWGINQAGQPVIGITHTRIDSVSLGQRLAELGLREAVMLDSGGSTSMTYDSESLVKNYVPRPVPHVVGLLPTQSMARRADPCAIATHF
ncbi:MAG: polysaccharide deacetylase family protein [Cyanobacteria bacterium P01_E01_bin.6]